MIPKTAVKAFIGRELDDYRPMKRWSIERIEKEKAKLKHKPPHWKKLRRHQRVCMLLGAWFGRWAFWLDTGTGKTLLSLAIARYFEMGKEDLKLLVCVPARTNLAEWVREIKKHDPTLAYTVLRGSSADKWALLETEDSLLYLVTYGGLVRMACDMVKSKKKKGDVLAPNKSRVAKLQGFFDGVIMDESTEVGNINALAARVIRQLVKDPKKHSFALSGTPFGKDPTPLWSQMYLVDQGETLGPNLGMFRAAFFREVPNYWSGFPDYVFDKKKEDLLNRMLAHGSIRYKADAADLPKRVDQTKYVDLPEDIGSYYESAKAAIRAARGNYLETKNAFMRMRQITSGWLGYDDDELGRRAQFEFPVNPKLELLLKLVQDISPDYKMVVFNQFVFSGSIICRELQKLDVSFARIYGNTKDPDEELRRFTKDESCRVFVVGNDAGWAGLNLQMAKYAVYYESPIRPIIRTQTERRVERQYSEHDSVLIIDLVARRTVDQRILDSLAAGKDLFQTVIEGKGRGV